MQNKPPTSQETSIISIEIPNILKSNAEKFIKNKDMTIENLMVQLLEEYVKDKLTFEATYCREKLDEALNNLNDLFDDIPEPKNDKEEKARPTSKDLKDLFNDDDFWNDIMNR